MVDRDWGRFAIVALGGLLAMFVFSELGPEAIGVAPAYGIVASTGGLALILFAWHIWIQTSPGGIDANRYAEKAIQEQVLDFVVVIAVSVAIGAAGAIIGIEGGVIEPGELWSGGWVSFGGATVVVLVGMIAGIYAGLSRNRDIQIQAENGRGE